MKNILKTSIFAFLLVAFTACTNDTDPVAVEGGSFKLLTPATGTVFVLSPATPNATVATFVWDASKNEVQTAPTYAVEISKKATNFAVIASFPTTDKYLALTVDQLNNKLIGIVGATTNPGLGLIPYTAADVDVRIKSSLGTAANAIVSYSNVITIKVTPFSTALPKLGVPGNHQGWTPSNAATLPLVASSGYGKTNYEGYMNLNGDYKFLSPKPDGTIDWNGDGADFGDDGSFSGVLKNLGESNCNAPAGYYLVKANTAPTGPGSLQYSATPITTWGVIGDATPGIWATSTPMTYSTTTKKWTVTVLLTGGKQLKFRANDAWLINLGKFDASQTGDNYAGANMTYNAANNLDGPASSGTYTITLDLSNPRDYKYTIQ
jgi:starch-binding outer membrane protein SusE/F